MSENYFTHGPCTICYQSNRIRIDSACATAGVCVCVCGLLGKRSGAYAIIHLEQFQFQDLLCVLSIEQHNLMYAYSEVNSTKSNGICSQGKPWTLQT